MGQSEEEEGMNIPTICIKVARGVRTPAILHVHITCKCGRRADNCALDGCLPRLDLKAGSCRGCRTQDSP